MSPDPEREQERTHDATVNKPRTDTSDEGDGVTGSTDTVLTRRTALIGAGLGLGLLGGSSQSAAAPPGQRWKQDVDADGNDLLNLGGLNTVGMDDEARIADFAGSNLEIGDQDLNVSDRLEIDRVDLENLNAVGTVSASTVATTDVNASEVVETVTVDASDVEASDLVRTPQLTGGVTDGERLQQLAGDNLTITDNRLDAISRWRRRGVLLEPSDEDVDGIEVEDVESPDSGDLNVEAEGDLTLSISGGGGAIRIETDGGHRVVVDDGSESISVEDSAGNSVEMDSETGEVSVSAAEKLTLDAPKIELSAGVDLSVQSDGNTELVSSGITDIDGALVDVGNGGSPAASVGDLVEDGVIETGSPTVLL